MEDTQLLPEEIEKRIGGQGEPSQSLDVPTASPRGDLANDRHERVKS